MRGAGQGRGGELGCVLGSNGRKPVEGGGERAGTERGAYRVWSSAADLELAGRRWDRAGWLWLGGAASRGGGGDEEAREERERGEEIYKQWINYARSGTNCNM